MKYDFSKREEIIKAGDAMWIWAYLSRQYNLLDERDFYHYTDINGFLGIIKNQEFWVSHIKYMNDSAEYTDGKNICERLLSNLIDSINTDEKELLLKAKSVLNIDKSLGFSPLSSKDVFSLSFTRDRDSLDMWRGYGNRSGIAIGFDIDACFSLPGLCLVRKEQYDKDTKDKKSDEIFPQNERALLLHNIIYDNNLKETIISDVIDMGLEYYKTRNDKRSTLEFLSDLLFAIFPYMKNEGFKNENECRFVDNISAISKSGEPLKIEYRERNGIILPFIKYKIVDLNCRPIVNWPIKEIVVGPGLRQKDLAESIRYFLIKQGLEELSEKIVLSNIPYISTM